MKKLLLFVALLFVSITSFAQLNLFTSPPLTGGNGAGSGGITFNVRANSAILIDSIFVALYGTLNATTELEVWYSTTPINGNPQVGTNPAFTQLLPNQPTIVGNSGTSNAAGFVMSRIAMPGGPLLIPAGSVYGFYVGVPTGSAGSPVYQTFAPATGIDTFFNSFITIYTGTNVGYGGARPTHVNSPRQFVGGLSYIPASGRDTRLAALVSPVTLSVGANTVTARVQNAAADPIAQVDFGYQLNNDPPVLAPGVTIVPALSPGQNYNHTFTSPINIPAGGTYQLRVWANNANGLGADNNTANDTLAVSLCTGLSGNYTVGGSGASYPTIQSAIAAINQCGITGPVTFQINPGTYIGSYTIGNFSNPNNANVTFVSLTGTASDVILIQDTASATTTNRSHFTINTSSRITFQQLTLRRTLNPGAAGQGVFVFSNASTNGEVIGCNLIDVPQTNSTNNNGIIYRGSNGLILNNTFNGFYYAVWLDGPASNTFATANTVATNTFTNNVYRSVYALNQANAVISGNQFSGFVSTSTAGASIWTANNIGTEISSNNISGAMSAIGILVANPNMDTVVATNVNRIFNNVINGFQSSTITSTALTINPINISGSFSATANNPRNPRDVIEVMNNTVVYNINTTSTSTTQAGLYFSGGSATTPVWSRIVVRNNHLEVNPTAGNLPAAFRLYRFSDQSQVDSLQSSNNNFRMGGTTPPAIFRVNGPTPGVDHVTIASWNTATGRDSASVSIPANFLSSSMVVPTNISLDNLGTPVSYITNDITGTSRSATTPDIGAYEFQGRLFAQITHSPLSDTLASVATRSLSATIADTASSIVSGTARVFYKKLSQSTWQVDSLPTVAGNSYSFTISHTALGGVAVFDTIEYYLAVRSASGVITTLPLGGDGLQLTNAIPPSSTFRYLILGNINGTYRVGTSGPADFPSLTVAANFINSGLITGPATFVLIDTLYSNSTGESFPITVLGRPGSSATNTITIRPDTSRSNVVVQGTFSGSNGLIVIRGTDNFIIDGSNNGTSSRNLTIRTTSTSDNTAAIFVRSEIANPATNIGIRNLSVEAGSNTITSTFGIVASSGNISTSATADSLRDFIISNVVVKRAYFGIFVRGSAATLALNVQLLNNHIGDTSAALTVNAKGIDVQNLFNGLVQGNTITNITGTTSVLRSGIEVGGTGSQNVVVNANLIAGVRTPATNGANGLYVISGNDMTLTNNVIRGVATQNGSATSNTGNAFGIRLGSGTGHRVYYNTIHMSGNYSNASTAGAASAAFNISSTAVTNVDVRNNIFSNTMTSVATGGQFFAAVWLPTSYPMAALLINNNAYHVDTSASHIVGRIGTVATSPTYFDVQAWKQVTDAGIPGNDGLSVPVFGRSRAPFVSDVDLRIVPGTTTGIESGAIAIASLGLPNRDFDQIVRPASGGQAPDMGAYEFTGVALSDVFQPRIDSVQITPRANQCAPTPRTVSVFARDNALGLGIDSLWLNYTIDTIAQPRVLLTRTSGTALNGVWTGVLPAATGVGRVVRASVVARDSAANFSSIINVGTFTDDYIVPNAGNDTTILSGDSATLRATGSVFLGTVGTGTAVNTTTTYPAPYGNFYWGARQQYLILASELSASGIAPGQMTSLAFDVVTPSGTPLQNFTISLGHTTQTSMTAWVTPVTQVYTAASFTDSVGWNTHTFQTPFNWDGSSNLVVEVCFQNSSYISNSITRMTNMPFVASYVYRADAAGVCANTSFSLSSNDRPNMRLGGGYPSTWTNLSTGTAIATNQTSVVVRPVVTTSYSITLTDGVCSKSDTVTVFVTPNNINDVSMEQILLPSAVPTLNQPYTVQVVLRNNGNVPAANFDVAYRVVGGPEINANPVTRTIQPNDTIHYTFTQAWTPTTGGNLRLSAYVRWIDDVNPANDTAFAQFNAVKVEEVHDLLRRVYPNPADQFVMFDFGSMDGVGTLVVRDQLGRLVLNQIIDLSTGAQHQVRTADLAAGVYTYQFVLKSKVQNGQLLIKR